MEAKDNGIQQLKQQLAQQQEENRQRAEQILEIEEYVRIQEDYFVNPMAEAELQTNATQEVHKEEKQQLESANTNLQKRCIELEARYEKKRLDLLVAEAKLMQAEGGTNA